MPKKPISGYQVTGTNESALFTLKIHRGDGMALLAMNWKDGKTSKDFVGFSIEYKEPKGDKYFPLRNRISFPDAKKDDPNVRYTLRSPLQIFRWVHFPRNAEKEGLFTYKVKPVFMNDKGELSYGESQQCSIALARETYPNALNVTFTRGFVSSQAFVDNYEKNGSIKTIIPGTDTEGLDFVPTHPDTEKAAGLDYRTNLYYVETNDFGQTWQNAQGKKLHCLLMVIFLRWLCFLYCCRK